MATNGNDFLFFQGSMQHLNMMLMNAYSDDSVLIDDEYNVNTATYDGMGGNDVLLMSSRGDGLFLLDLDSGNQMVYSVETFVAGNGGDVIALDHEEIVLGDLTILGGAGDDILWGNAGDDVISGSLGNDHIHGGTGDDTLNGQQDNDILIGWTGNDTLWGNAGDDYLDGGAGNDILYGGNNTAVRVQEKTFVDDVVFPDVQERVNISNLKPPGDPALGINANNLSVDFDTAVEITFREGFAGYNNTLGMYRIDTDGNIRDAEILFTNVKDAGIGVTHTFDLPGDTNGGNYAFFIIANGDRVNQGYKRMDLDTGSLDFVYDFGKKGAREALEGDAGKNVSLVYTDESGDQIVIRGKHYHTTDRDGDTSLNWDGQTHVISGLVDEGITDVLRIGFEDLPYLGDADFEDVLFDVSFVSKGVDNSEQGSDILIGGAGDDILYGEGGADILVVGEGADIIHTGTGADQVVFDVLDALVDTVTDFNAGAGDVLNITDILEGYDAVTDAISDFVALVANGSDVELHVNSDGDTGGAFTHVATVEGGLGSGDLADLINAGTLVVDSSVQV